MYDETTQEAIRQEALRLIKECGGKEAARFSATQRALKEKSKFWSAVSAFLSDG